MVMRHIFFLSFVVLSLLSASCTSALPSFKPYKMDIQQGNVVTSKMMLQLRPGMSKSQVRFIMGTPLIQDAFHSNRLDYFYQMRKKGKIIEQRRVILDFENEALLRVRGDVIPAGTGDGVAEPSTGTSPVSKPEQKKGLMDKLQFWKGDEKKAPEPQSAPAELMAPTEPAAPKEMPAAPKETPAAQPEPVAQPEVAQPATPEPVPVAEPAKPEPVKALEPAKVEVPVPAPAPAPVAKPEPAPAEKPMAEPVVKPVEKPMVKPAEKPVAEPKAVAKPQAETKPAPTPAPQKEPAEDEPGYFEYMLQKIGF